MSTVLTETKSANDALHQVFEEYKSTNDARLDALERGRGDVLHEEKMARLDEALNEYKARMDEMALKAARPAMGMPEDGGSALRREHKTAFDTYMRSGEASGLKRLEHKAMRTASDADGGYVVPLEIDREIARRLAAISPIRAIADVRTISSGTYRKPVLNAAPVANWVSETAARPETDSPSIDALAFPAAEIYAMPAASPTLLEDAAVDLEQWLISEVDAAFAVREGAAFVSGDGVNKPKGFLSYTNVAQSTWSWGNVGYIATGVAGNWPVSNPSDILLDLLYALKAGYRQNATFVCNRKTQSAIRKFKDSTGQYLWQPPAQAGGKATLMTFPVVEAEDMPDIASNSYAIALGDFRRGYLVVDRAGVRVLRDPFSAKPYVLFYTTKRVGGGIQDFDAIKLLKFGVS